MLRASLKAAVVSAAVVVASAQSGSPISTTANGPPHAKHAFSSSVTIRAQPLKDAGKATDIIGARVNNYQNAELGRVDDLLVDLESGRIAKVIVSTRRPGGVAPALTAVAPGAMYRDPVLRVIQLDAEPGKFEEGPSFDFSRWSESGDTNRIGTVEPSEERFVNRIRKVSTLLGRPVANLEAQILGKIDNLVVDLRAGRIVAVILSAGGFITAGDLLNAVPPTALRFSPDGTVLTLDASKKAFDSGPSFRASQWPDFGQSGFSASIYRAYHLQPYFETAAERE